ncbi:MAG: hypothetical protein Q8P34_06335 [Bacteroidota bacterium]|nr:hypothetical protein [Bacteroidota bacterium]
MVSDPEWYIKNPPAGVKIGKAAARIAARPNQVISGLISKTESEMIDLLTKLHHQMTKSEVEW